MKGGPFEMGRVYLGDCRDLMRQIPERSIDAIVADPPYSSGGQFRGDRARSTHEKYVQTGQRIVSSDFAGDTRDQRAYTRWSEYWLRAAFHRSREGAFLAVFTDWRQLPAMTDAVQMAGWVWRGIAVWDKGEGVRPFLGRFRAQAEYIVWGSRGPMPMAGDTFPGVFKCGVAADGNDHQTAKPVTVAEWLLGPTKAGAIVLDPFAGGGTTGVACKRMGREFLGFELDPVWCDYANRRLGVTASEAGTSLFA